MSGNSSNASNPKFTDFMRRSTAVPHSEIKAKLEAEKKAKRTSKVSSICIGRRNILHRAVVVAKHPPRQILVKVEMALYEKLPRISPH
jgi:hypothetical protein